MAGSPRSSPAHLPLRPAARRGARDYLEKIFQIPFWLEPLDAASSRRMLRGFVGGRRAAARRAPGRRRTGAGRPATGHAGQRDGRCRALPAPARRAASARPLPASRELLPRSLEIEPLELACMDELAPLLGRSPRALKRFVNTYRLIKVRAEDPAALFREDAPIAPTARCCSCSRSAPARRTRRPCSWTPRSTPRPGASPPLAGDGEEGGRIDAWLTDAVSARWRELDAVDLRPWAGEVVRFTFHWHAQSRYS